ncbi:MAG: hypothetical protein P8163_20305 [Candidatus Thiodiazotropha sp.]
MKSKSLQRFSQLPKADGFENSRWESSGHEREKLPVAEKIMQ